MVEWNIHSSFKKNSLIGISNLSDIKEKLIGNLGYNFTIQKINEKEYNIPKIIHFMWIFSPIPEKYILNVKKCIELNKDKYKIYLWVDYPCPDIEGVEIKMIDSFDYINNDIYQKERSIGKGPIVDMLRYEIIYKYGGIYSDIDAIFTKSFDFNFDKSFVSYIISKWCNLTNAIFGFPKESNFMKFVIDCLRENTERFPELRDIPRRTGPTFFTTCYIQYSDNNIKAIPQEYLLYSNSKGYSYHTNDCNWI